jgi:hypothetical protein
MIKYGLGLIFGLKLQNDFVGIRQPLFKVHLDLFCLDHEFWD